MKDYALQIFILVLLIYLSGFFSASETAFLSLSNIAIEQMLANKEKNSKLILALSQNRHRLIYTILIGNNLVNIGATAFATSIAIKLSNSSGVGIATAIMTVLIIIFGELTPKSMAASNAKKIATRNAPILYVLTILAKPLLFILETLSKFISVISGREQANEKPAITEEDLKTIVSVSHREGVLEGDERTMIENVFEFKESYAKDIMTPWTDIAAIDIEMEYDDIISYVRDENYSRIPVYEDDMDHIVGVLHVKDLIRKTDDDVFDIKKIMHKPFFTFEYNNTPRLFEQMRKEQTSIAIVLDEYGGTSGLITYEDLIEEIVGDINDEYDEDEDDNIKLRENEYIVAGNLRLDDFNELTGATLESDEYETINGFIIGLLGRFPKPLEIIEFDNIKFTVLFIKKNRIEKLKVEIKVIEPENEEK